MNHIERIDVMIDGDAPDRVPVSFWRHFYHREDSAGALSEAMLAFQREYDWDLMKVNPRAGYHVQPWGARLEYSGNEFKKTRIAEFPVNESSDWDKIEPVRPDSPAFSEQLEALVRIGKGLRGELYFVQTVFSPLSVAGDLVGDPQLLIDDMKNAPKKIHQVLTAVTESLAAYAVEVLNTGAAGLFFATTEWATRDSISEDLYTEFGKPYDLKVLEAVREAKFNVLHVCKPNNMLPLFVGYPFNILSYADKDEGNMSFSQANELFEDKIIMGGLGAKTVLLNGSPDDVIKEAQEKEGQLPAGKWILGPSCSIPPEVPRENLRALRKWVDSHTAF